MQRKRLTDDYHDYVIRDGVLVADFEGLYQDFSDPWSQSTHFEDSRSVITVNWCKRLRATYKINRVMELGCGLGYLSGSLSENSFEVVGVDISPTAIDRAKLLHPRASFINGKVGDRNLISHYEVDVFIMADITWYILEELNGFIEDLKNYALRRESSVHLIHLLTTYPPGIQKYGNDFFTNNSEILSYFKLNYLESGIIQVGPNINLGTHCTYFVARV